MSMPVTEMIVGIAGGLFLLTAFLYFLRLVQAWLLHRTLRDAISRDSALAEGLLDRIAHSNSSEEQLSGDDRNGLVLIALGLAIAGFALIVNDPEWQRHGLGAALFPLLVGTALLGRHLWLRRIRGRDVAPRP
jgi:hypothetical protein